MTETARALQLVSDPPRERVTAHGRPEPAGTVPLALHWRAPDGSVGRIGLDGGTVSVGAHAQNQVVLEDRFVSGFHCRLHLRDGRVWVEDLASTNGTVVDGSRVAQAEVTAGSTLRVGSQILRIERDAPASPAPLPGVITCDPVLGGALEMLRRAAPSRLPVLILGESGSGKEVAARAVHELSPRAGEAFVPVNCGAISPELAEAELFGHERGAFTGAIGSSPGAFGAADGGTLFLDEIGDLPLPLQVKLLRALEAGEVKPVGSPRPRRIDVRIVCATHRDLKKLVRAGSFREDLYYRLAGLTVSLPPLRDRREDILPLAEHFLAQESGGAQRGFSADARARLVAHAWPGNARELRHVVQLAAILTDGPIIRGAALRIEDGQRSCPAGTDPGEGRDLVDLRGRTLEQIEEMAIRSAWERHRGRRGAMARELGIARSSLLRKLDELGLRDPARGQER
ncbi:MAG TPA: sigma 54-interacting transcriptional regulator [Myxococcales bacterium]|nr:sigma 54-interacting transcriptional regulator [Myxococcales bacterium]